MTGATADDLPSRARCALREDKPVSAWPADLRAAYDTAMAPRQHAEARYLVGIGMAVLVATMVVDAFTIPERVATLALMRLVLVVPLQLAVLLLPLRLLRLQQSCLAGSLVLFGLILLRASFWAPEPANAYMAFGPIMLFGIGLPVLPLTRVGQFLAVAASLAGIALVLFLIPNTLAGRETFILIAALAGSFALVIAGRHRDLGGRNFLLTVLADARSAELEESNRRLADLSRLDPLTGLSNRRHAAEIFAAQYAAAPVTGEARVAVLMIDLDHFKDFNDRWGHQAGDDCLCAAADIMRRLADAHGGLAARYGGEEFIVLLRVARDADAILAAEELRRTIECAEIAHRRSGSFASFTTSIGIAIHDGEGVPSLDRLIEQADAALYQAKRSGRNRAVLRAA